MSNTYCFSLVSDEQEDHELKQEDTHVLPTEDCVDANSFIEACKSFMRKHNLNEILEYFQENLTVEYTNGINGMACKYDVTIEG